MPATLKAPPAAPVFYVRKRPSTSPLSELSCVSTLVEVKTYDTDLIIPIGTTGTIVLVHNDGAAFDVEFVEPAGIAALAAEDIRPLLP